MPAGFHVASAWVDIHAEDAGLRAEIQNAIRSAAAGADTKVKLDVDASALRAKVESAVKTASAGAKGEVKLDLDSGALRSKIEAALSAASAGARAKVGVDLDEAGLRSRVSAAVAAAGAGQRVRVGLDVDRGSLDRAQGAMRSIARDSERAFGGGNGGGSLLDRRSGLGSMSIRGLAAALTIAEPLLGSMIGPVKALTSASASLIPAFLGLGLSAAAIIVGTRGVGTAMKDANKDAVKYGVGLNAIAPSAQEFVRSVAGMGGAFTQLRLPVQQELFRGLGQQMQNMAGTSLPVITAGLTGMAGVMNTAFKGVLQNVNQLASSGVLGAMFGGIQTAFKPLTAIPGQFVDILAKMSIAASPLLTRMTTGIGNAMTGLTKKIDDSFASGRLQANIDKAGAAVGRFFTNFKNNDAVQAFFSNMKQMGPAAAQNLQKIGEAGLTLLNSSSGIGTALLKIGGAAATLVNAVPPGLLSNVMMLAGGFRVLSLTSAGVTRATTAIRGLGASLGVLGGGRAIQGEATALRNLGTAGNSTAAVFGSGALSATAIRARAAAMAGEGIAVRQMSTRLSQAGTSFVTFGGQAATGMTAVKIGAAALGATFLAMKGVDAIAGKIFGVPANVKQMAQGFTEFAATGKLTGITAKTLGDNFGKFGQAVQEVAHGNALDKIQNSLARGFAWTGLDAFKDKNKDLVHSVDDTLASLVKAGKSDVAGTLFNSLAKGAEKGGTSVGKLQSMLGNYNKALKEQATAEKIAAASMGTFGTEAIKTQKLLGQNKGEVQGLAGSYNALGRFNASATGAQLTYNQSVSKAEGLLKNHTNALTMQNGVLNTTTPKAQAAAGAMLSIAEAAKKSGEAFTGKGDFAAAAQGYEAARKQIEALGRAQGLTAAQAKEFTNQVLPIDTAKMYAANIQKTAGSFKQLTAAMAAAPKNQKLFNFDANTFQSTARAALTAVGAQVKTLSNGKMQVKVDTADAMSKVKSLGTVFDGLSKGLKTVKIPAADIGKVGDALKAAGMNVKKISDTKIKITAQDGTSMVIEGIKGKLKSLEASASKLKLGVDPKGDAAKGADALRKQAEHFANIGKNAGTANDKAKGYGDTVKKILDDPKLNGHGKSDSGLGAAVGPSASDTSKLQSFSQAMQKLAAGGKNVQVAVSISGTEQIDKLKSLNAVKNKSINVQVNISGTEQIDKLKALNAVNNKSINVQVNISGTEQIDKLKALNEVDNKFIQVQVSISGTEQIDKLKALNEVNNKSIQVSVAISGTEQIDKLKALNEVNNKSIQVNVSISGTEQIDKLKTLNEVNNKNIQVNVSVSGTDQIAKLKELNNVSNKNISVNVNISGADQISKLKELNNVSNKSISITVTVSGVGQATALKSAISGLSNKHVAITVTANAGPVQSLKSALAGISNKHVSVTVTANAGPVNALKAAISSVQGKSVTVTANVNGLGAVQALISAIAAVQSKTVTVTVNTVKTGSAAGGGMMSHDTIPGFSVGGRSYKPGGGVYGLGSGTSDDIMARLSNGEFVIRAAMVKKYGTGFLAAINHGALGPMLSNMRSGIPGFADGGSVSLGDVQPGDRGEAVLLIQKALKMIYPEFDYSSGPGVFGPRTQAMYSRWQQSLGYSGSGANGSPGMASLVALANRTGEFSVRTSQSVINYVIKWGDTLTSIARKFGTSVDELVKLNHISNPDRIYAGNNLKIPIGGIHVPNLPPAVIPGTKPGDWNYLAPPTLGKASRRKESDGKKEVGEIDTLNEMGGASTYAANHFFSNRTGTNSGDLVNKITESTDQKSLSAVLDDMRTVVGKGFNSGAARDKLQDYLVQGGKIEQGYRTRLDAVNKSLEDAKKTQDELNSSYKSLVDSVGQAVMSFGTLVKTGKSGASTSTMIRQLTLDAGTTQQFSQGLAALSGRGLNSETMAQIAAAGPVEGGRTIQSLLKATPEQLAQINALQAQISKAANDSGTLAAQSMYGAGLAAANGLVDGLTSQKSQIEAAMKMIAEAMKLAIRQALGIASPSKVTHGYGVNIIQGLIRGMQNEGSGIGDAVKALVTQIDFRGAKTTETGKDIGAAVQALLSKLGIGGDQFKINGKTVEEIVHELVEKMQARAKNVILPANVSSNSGTITPGTGTVSGDLHIGNIHVTVQCDSGTDLSKAEDAEKMANQLVGILMDKIREENRKRM